MNILVRNMLVGVTPFALIVLAGCAGEEPGDELEHEALPTIETGSGNQQYGGSGSSGLQTINTGNGESLDVNNTLPTIDVGSSEGPAKKGSSIQSEYESRYGVGGPASWTFAGNSYTASSWAYFFDFYTHFGALYPDENYLQIWGGFDFFEAYKELDYNQLARQYSWFIISVPKAAKAPGTYKLPEEFLGFVGSWNIRNSYNFNILSCISYEQDESPLGTGNSGTLVISKFNDKVIEGHFEYTADCIGGDYTLNSNTNDLLSFESRRTVSGEFSAPVIKDSPYSYLDSL